MRVKLNGEISKGRKLNGGGTQGAIFGIRENLVESNISADCVGTNYRFKQD